MVLKAKGAVKNQQAPKSEESSTSSEAKKTAPGRPKSPGRPRSPARPKSPSRRNPPRTTKGVSPPPLQSSTPKVVSPKARTPLRRSPSRKSPTRIIKTTVTKSAETYFSEKVQRPKPSRLEVDSDSDNPDGYLHSAEKLQSAGTGRARRLEVKVEKLNLQNKQIPERNAFDLIKRTTRNSHSRDIERIVHLKNFDNVAKRMGEFSDEDDSVQLRKSVSVEKGAEFKQITEFGGLWGALICIVLIPLAVLGLFIACNEDQCSLNRMPNFEKYGLFSTYFHLPSLLGFLGYAIIVALLSAIPFGGKQVAAMPTKQGKFTYTMNGLFTLVVLLAITLGLEFNNIRITNFITKHLLHIFVASTLFGFFLSCYSYIQSFYVPISTLNVHAVGRNPVYAFFVGRQINPRAFGLLDLKMYTIRMALLECNLLDFVYLYASLDWTTSPESTTLNLKSLNPTLIVLVVIQLIYFLDAFIYESTFVSTFKIQYEGYGYMVAVGYAVYPFMAIQLTKYIADYHIQFATWKLVLLTIIFAAGYVFYRGSNNQKDAFRKNPYDPALSHLETIPTTKGRKLLCSGFWGFVRHPNYFGDIVVTASFAAVCWNIPPVLPFLIYIFLLIHRCGRDNERCKQKYGAAWDRYCSKVKYVLLPKVY